MENQQEQIPAEKQAKTKKKSKIDKVFELHQKEVSVKDIAKKMKLSERVVRSYVWRKKNPQKYRALLQRYFAKRKQKKEVEEMKAKAEEQKQTSK